MDTSTNDFELDDNDMCEQREIEEDKNDFVESSNDNIFYPQVASNIKPKIGQEFFSLDDAYEFYNSYARAGGFSVRRSCERKNSDKEIIRKEFCCSKEGKCSVIVSVESSRNRGATKEDCKAKIVLAKLPNGNFGVKVLSEAHSHPLTTPSRVHFLRSQRRVTETARSLSEEMSKVNIPSHQRYSLMGVQAGGLENVGFLQRDLLNHERNLRKQIEGHDGEMLNEYLKLEHEKNPSSMYKIETGDKNKITRVFWADATMRQDYSLFGDVVIFDTTYNTNRYGLMLAPLVGVNNHGQTVVFACDLISDETIDSFLWLFTVFLEAMSGSPPKMIITDQDASMINVIPKVLPSTYHRYCSWHILNKFSDKIDSVKYKASYDEFSDCIWNSRSKEEFDSSWDKILKKYDLEDNKWLKSIFDIRPRWVLAYVNHIFSAGMTSSQRVESNHAFFKKIVGKNNSLVDFMIRFSMGLQRQRQQILFADHIDKSAKPKMKVFNTVLSQVADVYTREIFYKFQDELLEGFNYKFQHVGNDGENLRIYRSERKKVETDRGRELVHDIERGFVSCSCKCFESSGIPCRHILGFLHKNTDFEELPEAYVLKRWTKSVKSDTILDDDGVEIIDDKSFFQERNRLVQCFMSVVDMALTSAEKKQVLIDALKYAKEKTNALVESGSSGKKASENDDHVAGDDENDGTNPNKTDGVNDDIVYGEPNKVGFKGCGKRLKNHKENALSKKSKHQRQCTVCKNTGHNRSTCPEAKTQSSQAPLGGSVGLDDL